MRFIRLPCLFLTIFMATPTRAASLQIVESFLRSKAGECLDVCEDDFVVTPDYACVVDGVTSPTGRKWTCQNLTGGKWACQVLCNAVKIDLRSQSSPTEIVSTLTESLQKAYQQEEGALQVMTRNPEERATALFVLYSKFLRQLVIVGDCQAALVNKEGEIIQCIQPEKHVDTVTAQARAMFWQATLLGDKDEKDTINGDPGRDLIQPLLLLQRRFQNNLSAPKPYRYWAVDGFPLHEEGILVYDIPESCKEIILASDGYPKLYSTLQETEEHLQKLIRNDPLMIHEYLAGKGVREGTESFDDRTYLRIRLENDEDEKA